MEFPGGDSRLLFVSACVLAGLIAAAAGADIFQEWHVRFDSNIRPISAYQSVITINGMFPGPLINATTNDNVHINVFNEIDEPVLFTWNGIQQRLNSWQDGVSGTNCAIQPGRNWTYVFQMKDQIGSFFYFPSINFQKAGGGFGPIRINNRIVINVPFPKPEAEFDLLIGDWYEYDIKTLRSGLTTPDYFTLPNVLLMNGKDSYLDPLGKTHESFHCYARSVLVTADQEAADYYIVASPKMVNSSFLSSFSGVGLLHYNNSTTPPSGSVIDGPDPFDLQFSIDQAKSIRWNLTTGAARPNPQGTFNVTNVTITQTFVLRGSTARIDSLLYYTINNVSYLTPNTPLKLADHFANGTGVYELDQFPVNASNVEAKRGVFVASGLHKGWLELVFQNDLEVIDSWHLDGFGFFVVGFGDGEWKPEMRNVYNLYDPVVRSTVQVYPGGWTAVYVYLDNPGMWNLRSQLLMNWYLGQELYMRVYSADPNPAKERPSPQNLLLCGIFNSSASAPAPHPNVPSTPSSSQSQQITWFHLVMIYIVTILYTGQH
ncbi:monocopper oxidase-like protein SKU5 [Carica papaya]|uniref:monocopper oxidase-like protein SKU5 n=1 Tax=Carica papaya TaxID=3649 RepID=UPI000B8C88A6|nr:monocopper oxidase-like protein SKU5 [Carica papaya]